MSSPNHRNTNTSDECKLCLDRPRDWTQAAERDCADQLLLYFPGGLECWLPMRQATLLRADMWVVSQLGRDSFFAVTVFSLFGRRVGD